jgi:hypothetical protein
MTYTPGPYIIRNLSNTTTSKAAFCERYTIERVTPDGLRSVLADIHEASMCPEHGGTAETNAHLFAAAPDLLKALKDACDDIKLGAEVARARRLEAVAEVLQDREKSYRTIIAKAEGEATP